MFKQGRRAGAAGSPVFEAPAPNPTRSVAATLLAYLVVQGCQLGALFLLAPRFFWLDDSQTQFGPMAWWLGNNLRNGRPPLMDPDFGMAGNFTADMQYGVLDPLHWGLQWLIGLSDNPIVFSWIFGSISVLVLGTGSLAVLLLHRVRPALAIAGAVGIASSGFFLWYGSFWWPLMWSAAWLPWLWAGLSSKGWAGAVATGVATWALLASGNPYIFPFVLLIVAGYVWESRRSAGSFRGTLTGGLAARGAALFGGVVVASPTLLTALELAPLTLRHVSPDPVIGNEGVDIPNLVDVLLGGVTLIGQTNSMGTHLARSPAMATMLIAVPLLALVSWRKAFRSPGVLTAVLVCGAGAVFTQLPSVVWELRVPMRHTVAFQIFLPLLALVAVSAAPNLSRERVLAAGGLIAAQFTLAVLRSPLLSIWHLLATVVTAAALAAAIHLLRQNAGFRALAPVALVASAAVALLVSEQMMVTVQERVDEIEFMGSMEPRPYRAQVAGYEIGDSLQEYRDRSYAVDRTMTILVWAPFDDDRGWEDGIMAGNGNLLAGLKPGFGSLAVWQKRLDEHWCIDFLGATCDARNLLRRAEGTSRVWIDLLAADYVLLQTTAPDRLRRHFERNWAKVEETDFWLEYRRKDTLPGRVTDARNVEMREDGWQAGPAYAGAPMDTYVVSTGAQPGSLVFRIPYWPGLRATLDDRAIPISTVDRSLLRVNLPPEVSGSELKIYYDPIGARISTPATILGLLAILAAAAAQPVLRRRAGRTPGSGPGAEAAGQ
ncbi:MAG TPA: hypothetical protein VHI31_02210 [Actinomycetota bacterium]|nr:hypothetical protein [Actinomycetota bacterium]